MKWLSWLAAAAAATMVLPLAAKAQQGHYVVLPGGVSIPADQWKPGYRGYLPGAYGMIGQLNLTAQQEKALADLDKQWSKKQMDAAIAVSKKLPGPTGADAKDPAKVREWRLRRDELITQEMGQPPLDKIATLLTAEQLGKINEAEVIVQGWTKWLIEHMAKYDKQMNEFLLPATKEVDDGILRHSYATLFDAYYAPGARVLAPRLGLTKEQEDALTALSTSPGRFGDHSLVRAVFTGQWTQETGELRALLSTQIPVGAKDKERAAFEKILTDQQKSRLAKCVPILEQRNKELCDSYAEYVAKIDKVMSGAK